MMRTVMLACILGGVLAAETGGHGDLVREVAELSSNIQRLRESMAASLASLHGDRSPQFTHFQNVQRGTVNS